MSQCTKSSSSKLCAKDKSLCNSKKKYHILPKKKFLGTEKNSNWVGFADKVEAKTRKLYEALRVRDDYDLSKTLPLPLYKRVTRIIPIPKPVKVRLEEEQPAPVPDEVIADGPGIERKPSQESFNESTCSEILKLHEAFSQFELKTEKQVVRSPPEKTPKTNWFANYICKDRKDRIIWPTKIYDMEKKIWEKPLYEQAEHLMDAAAERFCDWVSTIGTANQNNISKDLLQSLFSLDSGAGLLRGMHIEPKQVKAVPTTVAERWNIPDMAMELKIERHMKKSFLISRKEFKRIAFSRTLPVHMRPWKPSENDKPILPEFPEELLTREKLFKGIIHLRSTKALINTYEMAATLDRPIYLEQEGCFEREKRRENLYTVPLYELLQLPTGE